MVTYPFLTAQILTELHFVSYGGHTGNATSMQVQAALTIAERQMTEYLGTYLLPVTVTGEYWVYGECNPFELPVGNVLSIERAEFLHACSCYTGTLTSYLAIGNLRNARLGYVDVRPHPDSAYCYNGEPCSCCGYPYKLQIAYRSGLDTGTTMNDPTLLMALTGAADLVLNEMVDPGGHEAQIGIQSFSSLKYSERRFPLRNTIFGSSARANYIANLVDHLKVKKVGRIKRSH